MQISIYNTLTRQVQPFSPIGNTNNSSDTTNNRDTVRMYSCGPTVYSYAHIGNMRAFLFADLLQRTLRTVGGYSVRWVMNITNIDDKTIRDSQPNSPTWNNAIGKQSGDAMTDLLALTQFYEKEFIADIEQLGINKADFYAMPKATDFIAQMQELIRKIIANGNAYIAGNSIYFNVSEYMKKEKYGKLFHIDLENFKANLRVDTDQYERDNVSDFVIWKGKKDGEPFWEFPINDTDNENNIPGRPGWHIECSAMEYELLGLPFDIHTGGIDLKFPHHEDEIAQSKAGYGIEPTNFFCHNEFLEVEGKKMSKSLGNFFTLRDLINKGIAPTDVRYAMLATHYRTKYNFTFNGIAAAGKARQRLQEYIYKCIESQTANNTSSDNISSDTPSNSIEALRNGVFTALADDLHTPKALAAIFTFINDNPAERLSDSDRHGFLKLMKDVNAVFNCWNLEAKEVKDVEDNIPAEVKSLAEQRLQAKANKQFADADRLRAEITALGYEIKDTKGGYELKQNSL